MKISYFDFATDFVYANTLKYTHTHMLIKSVRTYIKQKHLLSLIYWRIERFSYVYECNTLKIGEWLIKAFEVNMNMNSERHAEMRKYVCINKK